MKQRTVCKTAAFITMACAKCCQQISGSDCSECLSCPWILGERAIVSAWKHMGHATTNKCVTCHTSPDLRNEDEGDLGKSFFALMTSWGVCLGREEELPAHIKDMAAQCRQDEAEAQRLELETETSLQHLCAGLKECVDVLVILMQKFKLDQHAVSLQPPSGATPANFAI